MQASSGLIFDLLRRFDPDHVLLAQAEREVLHAQLDLRHIEAALVDCARRSIALHSPTGFTPLWFPLWTDGFRGRLSTEDWQARVRRAAQQLEKRPARYHRTEHRRSSDAGARATRAVLARTLATHPL